MLDQLINSSLSKEFITVVMAVLPVAELRLALPVGITVLDMPWYKAFYLSVIGNILPVPLLLLFFGWLSGLLQKIGPGKRFITWLLARTAKRAESVEKYKYLGLILFVAVPLPLTGAWTGSLIAYILGLRFWPSFLSIVLGVIGAGIIVTVLTLLGWTGAAIAILAIIILLAIGAWKL